MTMASEPLHADVDFDQPLLAFPREFLAQQKAHARFFLRATIGQRGSASCTTESVRRLTGGGFLQRAGHGTRISSTKAVDL